MMEELPEFEEREVEEESFNHQEDLASSGEGAWNKLREYKLVPWLNWDEWDRVRVCLFSSSPESVATALSRISAWKSKGCLPVAIEATAAVVSTQQRDPFFRKDKPPEEFSDSDEILVMLYMMSILRLVNGVIEKTRRRDKSIADAAEAINIPRMLIDVRHEGSHRELPSLPLMRDASIQAIKWLKQFYWEPQTVRLQDERSVSFQAGKEVGINFHFQARKVAEAKVHEAFFLVKEHDLSTSPQLISKKGQRAKKRFIKSLRFLGMLYSSYPLEVASVLFEIFLKDSDTYTEISGDIQCDHGQARPCWKFLTEELSKKRPQLLITLLNAVIDTIEAREANKHETGKLVCQVMLPTNGGKAYPIELLYSLCALVVSMLKELKFFTRNKSYLQTEVPMMKQIPRGMLVALARRFLRVAAYSDKQLIEMALEVVRLLKDEQLVNKLTKLCLLSCENADINSSLPTFTTSAEQTEYIELASRKLEVVRNISQKKTGKSHWRVARFWSPCPIGMLPPDANFSHNHFPILDCDTAEARTSQKREASCDIDSSSESSGKRLRAETADDIETGEENVMSGSGDSKDREADGGISQGVDVCRDRSGWLMIGGSWKRVRPEEIQIIKSSISILV